MKQKQSGQSNNNNISNSILKQKKIKIYLFHSIYKINLTSDFKAQSNIIASIICLIINLIVFISFKNINIINSIKLSNQAYYGMFGIFGLILLEIFICVFYGIQFYLGIQIKFIRYVLFPFCMRYFFAQILDLYTNIQVKNSSTNSISLFIPLSIIYIVMIFILSVLLCQESYISLKLYYTQIPINSHLLIVQVFLYLCEYLTSFNQNLLLLCSVLMLAYIIMIRATFFKNKSNDHLEYKILSINSFLYFIYAIIIFINSLSSQVNAKGILFMLCPAIIYQVFSQIVRKKIVKKNFNKIFNTDNLPFQQFALFTDHLIQQAFQFTQAVHSNFIESLTFTFYSQHEKYCEKPTCKFYTQNWREELRNISDPKTLKKLVQRVLKKIQLLFEQIHKNEPDNLDLKLSFAKFYIFSLPNKIRAMQLISQVQAVRKTIVKDFQIFKLKIQAQKMDNIQVIDNLKTDEQVNEFQKIAYLTINSIMQFWLQFSQQKIDLSKIISISQKLLSYKKKMQQEWQKNKNQQKYSTLKIFFLYSYYLRNILHDEDMAEYLDYNLKSLEQKLIHKKQIKYLSCGSEAALIGVSLSDSSLGKIVIANNQGSNLFNYSKNQISKIRVNEIMPKIFSDQHDNYLLQFHKNKYKQINSDQRSLFGKDKNGYLIPILLQLQRTISTVSQELIFVANIRKNKVRQTPIICITDQQGSITDISSGFKQVFYQKKQKTQKVKVNTKNIQQIIPKFFQQNQNSPQEVGNLKFIQTVKSCKCGLITIQFSIIPVSFPLKPNGGFVVLCKRQQPIKSLQLSTLSLTNHIINQMNQKNFQGQQVLYNRQKNRYQFDSFQSKFQKSQNQQFYTIPFINLHDMTSVFKIVKQKKVYGQKVRMVRFINGALIRVQSDQTFQSQQLSENQKANRFQFKLKQLKYQFLSKQKSIDFIYISRIIILLILFAIGILSVFLINDLKNQTSIRKNLLSQMKFRFQIRGYLSEYILSFQGLVANYNNTYFTQKTQTVRSELINVIEASSILQTQKQPILKTIYLQNEAQLSTLITQQTLNLLSSTQQNIKKLITLVIVFILFIGCYIIFLIFVKFFHYSKLEGVYNVFLGVDQKTIKKSYDDCMRFSRMLQQKSNQSNINNRNNQSNNTQPNNNSDDEMNQNPVRRMKKYKKSSNINLLSLVKYFAPLIIILIICIVMILMMNTDVSRFNQEYSIQKSIYKIFPQSSIALMNAYFKSYKKSDLFISQEFTKTYQNLESIIFSYETVTPDYIGQSFFKSLMNNVCNSKPYGVLKQGYKVLCEDYQEKILTTGLGKVNNYIASMIQNVYSTIHPNITSIDQQFFNIFQLQYDFYVPLISQLSNLMYQKMYQTSNSFQYKYSIWLILILLIIGLNSFYIWRFLLGGIRDQIGQAKELLHFIPDSCIQDKKNGQSKKGNDQL